MGVIAIKLFMKINNEVALDLPFPESSRLCLSPDFENSKKINYDKL
jgi:hypothetical protein